MVWLVLPALRGARRLGLVWRARSGACAHVLWCSGSVCDAPATRTVGSGCLLPCVVVADASLFTVSPSGRGVLGGCLGRLACGQVGGFPWNTLGFVT